MRRLVLALSPCLLLLLMAPAGAGASQISSAVSNRVSHPLGRLLGAIPARGVSLRARSARRSDAGPQPPPPSTQATCPPGARAEPFALCWFHGSVLHSNSVYTIFWAPPGLSFPPGYSASVNAYFADQAASSGAIDNVYSTDTQYFDSGGSAGYSSSFAGTTTDSSPFPALSCVPPQLGYTCVSDTDLTSELDRVIAAQGWPRGLGPVFFVFLPQGASVCAITNGLPSCSYKVFCAYHSAYTAGGSPPTLYAVEPYAAVAGCDTGQSPNASPADAVINTASHEHNETITDPLGDGWLDLQGNENGDKCASAYGPALGGSNGSLFNQAIGSGRYYIQEEFSNFSIRPAAAPDNGCAQSLPARPPTADFVTATDPVITGQPVSFKATVADSDSAITTVSWDFGDGGAPGSGTDVSRVYAGTGPHTVTLSVVDALGLRTQISHVIQVSAPNPHAVFAAGPNPVRVGQTVTFDGSTSSEPGGSISNWAWSFGDGTQGAGPVVRHSFAGAGPRTVTLVVSDSAGASNSSSQTVAVRRALLVSFGLVPGQSVRSVMRRGLRVRVRCSVARCRASVLVAIGRLRRRGQSRGAVVTVHVAGAALRALLGHRRIKLSVSVVAGSDRASAARVVRLRR